MGWFGSIAFGLNYSDRGKDKTSPESGLSTIGGGASRSPTISCCDRPTSPTRSAGDALAIDVYGVLAQYFNPVVYGTRRRGPRTSPASSGAWTRNVRPATCAATSTTRLGTACTLKGNVGVQVIETDQSSDGFFIANRRGLPRRRTASPTRTSCRSSTSPSCSTKSQAVRFGLAEEMARPRMDQLKATEESGYDAATGIPGGSGGNPRLDPWRASHSTSRTSATSRTAAATCRSRASTRTSTATSSRRPTRTTTTRTCWRSRRRGSSRRASSRRRPATSRTRRMAAAATCTASSSRPRCPSTCSRTRSHGLRRDPAATPTPTATSRSRARSARSRTTISRCRDCRRTCGTRRCTTRSTASAPASRRATARSTSAK